MSAPTQDDWAALKRLVRYLVYRQRVVVCFDRLARQDTIDGYSDTDWAGCPHPRKSTSSSHIMVGSHLLASSSTTQSVIATSSRESEVYAAVKTASRVFGGTAMAKDMALVLGPRAMIHASAAKGTASQRGVRRKGASLAREHFVAATSIPRAQAAAAEAAGQGKRSRSRHETSCRAGVGTLHPAGGHESAYRKKCEGLADDDEMA